MLRSTPIYIHHKGTKCTIILKILFSGGVQEHGFDCMDVVKEMEESHMKELGMAAGHVLKLRKRLSEMRPAKRREVARSGAPAGLLEGDFKEEESAASFQEALRAWRQGGQTPKARR